MREGFSMFGECFLYRTLGHTYQEVFTGEDFVAWLINVGLAGDRQEGVQYGEKLVSTDSVKLFYRHPI